MNIVALPAGLQRLVREALPSEPWRNGRGRTSLVAVREVHGQLVWRVSIAEIEAASPFSHFPGLDRVAVLIQGGPLQLLDAQRCWKLHRPGDEARFEGEAQLFNTAPAQKALVWNVMSRRGLGRTEVRLSQGQRLMLSAGVAALVWVLEGRYELAGPGGLPGGVPVDAGEGLRWSGDGQGLWLQPLSADARLLCTRLWG